MPPNTQPGELNGTMESTWAENVCELDGTMESTRAEHVSYCTEDKSEA